MTHVSMISLYDYKEKCSLVPSAQESVLSNSAESCASFIEMVTAKQVLCFSLKVSGIT